MNGFFILIANDRVGLRAPMNFGDPWIRIYDFDERKSFSEFFDRSVSSEYLHHHRRDTSTFGSSIFCFIVNK